MFGAFLLDLVGWHLNATARTEHVVACEDGILFVQPQNNVVVGVPWRVEAAQRRL